MLRLEHLEVICRHHGRRGAPKGNMFPLGLDRRSVRAVNRRLTETQLRATCRELIGSQRTVSGRALCAALRARFGAVGKTTRVFAIWREELTQAAVPPSQAQGCARDCGVTAAACGCRDRGGREFGARAARGISRGEASGDVGDGGRSAAAGVADGAAAGQKDARHLIERRANRDDRGARPVGQGPLPAVRLAHRSRGASSRSSPRPASAAARSASSRRSDR